MSVAVLSLTVSIASSSVSSESRVPGGAQLVGPAPST